MQHSLLVIRMYGEAQALQAVLTVQDLPSLYSKHMDTAFQEARIHKGQQVKR